MKERRERGEKFWNAKIWSKENEMGNYLFFGEILTRIGEKEGSEIDLSHN